MLRRVWPFLAGAVVCALVYGPAWFTHWTLRSQYAVFEAVPVDEEGFRDIEELADGIPNGGGTTVLLHGIALQLPLQDVTSVRKMHGDTGVSIRGSKRLWRISVFDEREFAPFLHADFAFLKALASAPAPNRLWPLLPGDIREVYERYAFKLMLLGEDRQAFDNGSVQGIVGRALTDARQCYLTMVAQHALVQVEVRSERDALAIAATARTAGSAGSSDPEQGGRESILARCIECALHPHPNCDELRTHADRLQCKLEDVTVDERMDTVSDQLR